MSIFSNALIVLLATTATAPGQCAEQCAEPKRRVEVVAFEAQNAVRSPALPPPPQSDVLDAFFADVRTVNLQFADRARVDEIAHPSDDLLEVFRRRNAERRLEAGLPAVASDVHSTRIVGLVNPPMHIIGLVLTSVTHVGIHVFKGHDANGRPNPKRRFPGYPEVQLTLLETAFEASGPGFLVRLFNKVMGGEDGHASLETVGFTRIWAEPSKEGVVFVNNATLEAYIRLPRLLLRVLPTSKKRLERRGSATLQNTITKDMHPAMQRLVDAYWEWIG